MNIPKPLSRLLLACTDKDKNCGQLMFHPWTLPDCRTIATDGKILVIVGDKPLSDVPSVATAHGMAPAVPLSRICERVAVVDLPALQRACPDAVAGEGRARKDYNEAKRTHRSAWVGTAIGWDRQIVTAMDYYKDAKQAHKYAREARRLAGVKHPTESEIQAKRNATSMRRRIVELRKEKAEDLKKHNRLAPSEPSAGIVRIPAVNGYAYRATYVATLLRANPSKAWIGQRNILFMSGTVAGVEWAGLIMAITLLK
jgi:hypothetical protein